MAYNVCMESYRIPAGSARQEIEVHNSRFIASAAPASSVEEARQFISQIKDEFKDATHNVPAFVIGSGASTISHCHDDGEPSGAAGRPAPPPPEPPRALGCRRAVCSRTIDG